MLNFVCSPDPIAENPPTSSCPATHRHTHTQLIAITLAATINPYSCQWKIKPVTLYIVANHLFPPPGRELPVLKSLKVGHKQVLKESEGRVGKDIKVLRTASWTLLPWGGSWYVNTYSHTRTQRTNGVCVCVFMTPLFSPHLSTRDLLICLGNDKIRPKKKAKSLADFRRLARAFLVRVLKELAVSHVGGRDIRRDTASLLCVTRPLSIIVLSVASSEPGGRVQPLEFPAWDVV